MYRWILPLLLLTLVIVLAGCPRQQTAVTPASPPAAGAVPAPGPTAGTTAGATAAAAPVTGEITAYIPCGMLIPMHEAIKAFEAKNPGVKVKANYENGVVIVKRLTDQHKPTDVVVTPGKTEMAALEAKHIIDEANKQAVGSFELVCIVPSSSKRVIAKPADLKQCKTIAMPNPDVNSTGTSGREALTKLGLYDTLKPRMVLPTHAIEAHTMVANGKADAGLAYKNCPLETAPEKLNKSKVRIAFSFPADSYQKQPCLVAASAQAANKAGAQALVAFLSSPEGLKVLADNGMTGCLEMAGACPGNCAEGGACAHQGGKEPCAHGATAAPAKAAAKPDIVVMAFYPGDEKHAPIRKLIEGLPKTYGERVSGTFVDFRTDEGYKIWREEKGLSCGGLLINDQQTWTYESNGKVKEVTFKMAINGEWTADDLHAVIKKLLKEKK